MKNYDEHKFCFIICTNRENYLQECLLYLSRLEIPDGYEAEVLTITDADSMTAGYNEGMRASNARYKIYLHQDTFIKEPEFLKKILEIYQSDPLIGIIGMVGAPKLPKDAVMWHGKRYGKLYKAERNEFEIVEDNWTEVEVVDGLLIATNEDIEWREDILKGWDFYDVSQCLEFIRAGKKVVVPKQEEAWVIHLCGIPQLWNYEESRKMVLENYPEIGKRRTMSDAQER